jgi:hypothetical protein
MVNCDGYPLLLAIVEVITGIMMPVVASVFHEGYNQMVM